MDRPMSQETRQKLAAMLREELNRSGGAYVGMDDPLNAVTLDGVFNLLDLADCVDAFATGVYRATCELYK